MLEEAIKINCKKRIELTKQAILNSQLSLESKDLYEANFYFIKAEELLNNAVNLMVDCGDVNTFKTQNI